MHIHFRKRVSVEEQRAQKKRPILTRETKLLTLSKNMSVQPEVMKQYKDSDLFNIRVHAE